MSDETLRDAAQRVIDAECQALVALRDLFTPFDAELENIITALDLPDNYRSDARRIAQELRSTIGFRLKNELPQLIQTLSPAPATTTES